MKIQFFKKSVFVKAVVSIITGQFLFFGLPFDVYAGLCEQSNLRTRAALDGGGIVGELINKDADGGTRASESASKIYVLSNLVSLLEGAETRGYNIEHAFLDNAMGFIYNHSEPRGDTEERMENMVRSIRDLINQGASDKTIRNKWISTLTKVTLAKVKYDTRKGEYTEVGKEIEETLPWLEEFRSARRDKRTIERLSRRLVNKVINKELKTTYAYSDKYDIRQTVLCVGETYEQYKAGLTGLVIEQDLKEILDGITQEMAQKINLRIAYEPRWAIGTGLTPEIEDINKTHKFIKDIGYEILGIRLGVDYGGSLKASNAEKILSLPNVSGGLIGGAAKDPATIKAVIEEAIRQHKLGGARLNIGMNWKAEDITTGLRPLSEFVDMFKTLDLSAVQIAIGTPQVKTVGMEMSKLEDYLATTHYEVEALISELEKHRYDIEARKQAISNIMRTVETQGYARIQEFMDIFLIKEEGRLDDEQIAALKSRLLRFYAPEKSPYRIGILGSTSVARRLVRESVSSEYDNVELVALIGEAAADIYGYLAVDPIERQYPGRIELKEKADFIYMGAQASAIKVLSSANFRNIAENLPWEALLLDAVVVDESMYKLLGKEGVKALNEMNIQVLMTRAAGDGYITYIPGLDNEEEVREAERLRVASTQETAVREGLDIFTKLSNKKPHFSNITVVQPHYGPVPPAYNTESAYQTTHTADRKFTEVLKDLGLSREAEVAQILKTQISHGETVELTVGIAGEYSKEDVIKHFKEEIATSEIIGMREDGVKLTSKVIWGEKRIMFLPETVTVKGYFGGTAVKMLFLIDEDAAHVSHILNAIARRPSRSPAVEPEIMAEEGPFAESTILAREEEAAKDANRARAEQKEKERADLIEGVERVKKDIKARGEGSFSTDFMETQMHIDKREIDILFPGMDFENNQIKSLKYGEEVVGLVVMDRVHNIITGTNLLTPPSLKETQAVLGKYYTALRKSAMELSIEQNGAVIEVVHAWKPEEKLRVRYEISAQNPTETTFRSFDRLIDGDWVSLSAPGITYNYKDFEDKYSVVIHAPGGRIGSLELRCFADTKDSYVIAASGGPTSEELADFLAKGDNVQGPYQGEIRYGTDWIELNGRKTIVFSKKVDNVFREPENLPWETFLFAGIPVMVAIDATGKFLTEEGLNKHRKAGALRVMPTAPGQGKEFANRTIVMNGNAKKRYNPDEHYFGSNASCTTGCLSMLNLVVELAMAFKYGWIEHDAFINADIEERWEMIEAALTKDKELVGLMTTWHALTSEEIGPGQKVKTGKKFTRGLGGADTILPTSTGAAANIGLVDRLTTYMDGYAGRFPTDVASLVISDYFLEGTFTKDDIIDAANLLEAILPYGVKLAEVDNSAEIKMLLKYKEAMAVISPSKIKITKFVSNGREMSNIEIAGWYENEYYYAFEMARFIDEVMRPMETKRFWEMADNGIMLAHAETDGGTAVDRASLPANILGMDSFPLYLSGAVVMIRIDTNAALDEDGSVQEDLPKMSAHVSLIHKLSMRGCKVVLLDHQGKRTDVKFSENLRPWAEVLSRKIGLPVGYVDGLFDEETIKTIQNMEKGDIILLQNVRAWAPDTNKSLETIEEMENSELVKKLQPHLDIFINDAFSLEHRAQPSVVAFTGIPNIAGNLMERELKGAELAVNQAEKPYVVVFGGDKVQEQMELSKRGLEEGWFSKILTAGILGEVCLIVKGYNLGEPTRKLIENKVSEYQSLFGDGVGLEALKKDVEHLMDEYDDKIEYPQDVAFAAGGEREEVSIEDISQEEPISPGSEIKDIGTATAEGYAKVIKEEAKTVYFKGPPGVYGKELFIAGSRIIMEAAKETQAFTLTGGGDITALLQKLGLGDSDMFNYTFLAGGGFLNYFLKGAEKSKGLQTLISTGKEMNSIINKVTSVEELRSEDIIGFRVADKMSYRVVSGIDFSTFLTESRVDDDKPRAIVVSANFFRKGAGRVTALKEILQHKELDISLALYGEGAANIKALFADNTIMSAETLDELIDDLSDQGIAFEDLVVLRTPQDETARQEIRQVVVHPENPATLVAAYAVKALLNNDSTWGAFKDFYDVIAEKEIIDREVVANNKEKILEELIGGTVFEFSSDVKVTDEVARDIQIAEEEVETFMVKL